MAFLFYLIYLLVIRINHVSLPNIIANKSIVPEILQGDVRVDKISYEIERLLYDTQYREENIKDLGMVKSLLSVKNSALETANVIADVLGVNNSL